MDNIIVLIKSIVQLFLVDLKSSEQRLRAVSISRSIEVIYKICIPHPLDLLYLLFDRTFFKNERNRNWDLARRVAGHESIRNVAKEL